MGCAQMMRVDVRTDGLTGFVIFDDDGPLQAMVRIFHCDFNAGRDDGLYWLRGDVMPAPIFSLVFIATRVDSEEKTA